MAPDQTNNLTHDRSKAPLLGRKLACVLATGFFLALTTFGQAAAADQVQLVAVDWGGKFIHLDPVGGELPPARFDLPDRINAIGEAPSGAIYMADFDGNVYTLDGTTGDWALVLANSQLAGIRCMAFASSGLMYYVTGAGISTTLHTLNLSDGMVTTIGLVIPGSISVQGLDFSLGQVLHGISPSGLTGYVLFTLDLDDAETHVIGDFPGIGVKVAQSLSFTPSGSLYAVGLDSLAQLDPGDGSVIGPVTSLSGDYRALAVAPQEPGAVPVLSSWGFVSMMLLLVAAGAVLVRRGHSI